jgi:hypothetical protein
MLTTSAGLLTHVPKQAPQGEMRLFGLPPTRFDKLHIVSHFC